MRTASRLRRRPADVRIPLFGIYIFESHHARSFQMEMGSWQFEKLCWVTVGKGKLAVTAESIAICKDDLLLIPAGVAHRFIDNPANPFTLVVVCFERAKLSGSNTLPLLLDNAAQARSIGGPLRGSNSRIKNDINDAFRRLLREQSAELTGYEVVLQAELANLLVRIIRGCTDSPIAVDKSAKLITDALQYLDEYYYKPTQLGELAKQYDISIRQFSALFKKRTGRTLSTILIRNVLSQRRSVCGQLATSLMHVWNQDSTTSDTSTESSRNTRGKLLANSFEPRPLETNREIAASD